MICGRIARIAIVLLVGLAGQAHAQAGKSADDAMARYRMMTSVAPKKCTADTDPTVITVCASKLRESQKVPYIEETRAGDRPKLALGEVPSANDSPDRATHCPIRGCPGNGSLLGAVGKLIERIRD